MLLERIDIDSCGSLERIQLGPFSHGLNAVFGPPGSGKTATIEFLRSVMLGTDRLWHHGCAGRVVWAGREGLLHCRREADGTACGRLSMDIVDRNGFSQNYLQGYRDSDNYSRMRAWIDLPPLAIDALVAPCRETSFAKMVEACRQLGLTETEQVRDEAEIQRVRDQLATAQHRLGELGRSTFASEYGLAAGKFLDASPLDTNPLDTHATDYDVWFHQQRSRLQDRRRNLVDELARLDRYDHRQDETASIENRRTRLEVRLADARDEVARLRNQESDLRRSLAEVERELADCTRSTPVSESTLRISNAWRLQLEELDNQLMRLGRTLREIRSIRDNWSSSEAVGAILPEPSTMRYFAADPIRESNHYYRMRLEAASRHLDWLLKHYDARYDGRFEDRYDLRHEGRNDSRHVDAVRSVETLASVPLQWSYIGRTDLDSMLKTIRSLIESLSRVDYKITASQIHDQHLRQCEATLAESIRRLVDQRTLLLERIATDHNLSVKHLADAFGDWRQCQDQPHLYQWLLSEHFPPRVEDNAVRNTRRNRLEAERTELLDELSRCVNRLDDSVREVRSLELRLRDMPLELPVLQGHLLQDHFLHDRQRSETVREELALIDSRLNWLESRHRLEKECQALRGRLEGLLAGATRPSGLRRRAMFWLDQMTGGRLNHLLAAENFRTIDGNASSDAAHDPFAFARATSQTERSFVALALRMAAADMLNRRGTQLPLLLDEPPAGWLGSVDTTPLISAWSRFVDGGNQLIAFTAHRGLVENVRNHGGFVQSLVPSRYYQMRYRDAWEDQQSTWGQVNRELDTVWREANGFYDDPFWYRPNQYSPASSRRSDRRGSSGQADDYYPKVRNQHAYEAEPVSRGVRGPASPFFLTEDSPVDQAPSIDAVAAQRLRMVGLTVVGQLLSADPLRLADRLQLADVSPKVITRWQNEANLVCGVPQLRNFDARVLVGCGFTSPSQLARMHPGRLLEKVEAFLATDRGRQILRSGSSYELSRITSWIAAANRSVARDSRHARPLESSTASREDRGNRRMRPRSRDVYVEPEIVESEWEDNARAYVDEGQPISRHTSATPRKSRRERREKRTRENRTSRRADQRTGTNPGFAATSNGSAFRSREARFAERSGSDSSRNLDGEQGGNERSMRFYLHRSSPIVDAPSIGPKTALKMQAMGLKTVDQLLNMDAAQIAARLGNRRITADRIVAWQRQATLVCRVPMLRGHDAQLLVEAGIHEPERLAECDPHWLLEKIDPIARSSEGKRILRGSRLPDLAEVTDWIRWAKDHRALRAA